MKIGFFILLIGIFSISCGEQAPEMTNEQKIQATVEAKLAHDSMEATVIAEYSKALTATAVPENSPTIALDSTEQKVEVTVVPIPTALPEPAPVKSELPDFEKHMENGIKFRENDQFEQALKEFTAALDIDQKSAEAFFQRGFTYSLIPSVPSNRRATAGEIEAMNNRIKWSLADLTQAILLDSSNAEYWFQRSQILWQSGAEDELIISDLTEAIKLNPMAPRYYEQRSKKYQSLAFQRYAGNLLLPTYDSETCQLAVDDITRAIQIDPTQVDLFKERVNAYDCLAWSYRSTDEWGHLEEIKELVKSQIKDLTSVINLEPTNAKHYAARAYFYGDSLDLHFLVPDNYVCKRHSCIPEWEIQYPLKAADYTRAIQHDPENPDYYLYRAKSYYEMFRNGYMDDDLDFLSLRDFKMSRELGEETTFSSYLKMEIGAALEVGDCDHAHKVMLSDNLNEEDRKFFRGRYHACKLEWDQAILEYRKAGWNRKTDYSIHPIEALIRLDQFEEARDELEAFISEVEDRMRRPFFYFSYEEAERGTARGNTRYYPELTKALAWSLITNKQLMRLDNSVYEDRLAKLEKLGYDTKSLIKQIEEITSNN